jgi:condensation domain-containing protein
VGERAAAVDARRRAGGPVNGSPEPGALSAGQEQMWFLHMLDPGSAAYSMTAVFRLFGELDEQALGHAADAVVDRHPALRTAFEVDIRGRPGGEVRTRTEPVLAVAESGDGRREPGLLRAFLRRPFALDRPPLCRMLLLRCAPGQWVLALAVDHIAADGWSVGLLLRDLRTCYAAARDGRDLPPPNTPDFDDAVIDEHVWLTGPQGVAARAAWREQLGGLAPPSTPPGPGPGGGPGRLEVALRPDLVADLERAARAASCSLLVVAGAALVQVLRTRLGQPDVAVGTPMANRGDGRFDDTVGLFTNVVVLRPAAPPGASFAELVDLFADATFTALENQRVPFPVVVADVVGRIGAGRNPLFRVMFAVQDVGVEALELPGVRTQRMHAWTGEVRFDLEWVLWRVDGALRLHVTYDRGCYPDTEVEQLVADFVDLLQQAPSELVSG